MIRDNEMLRELLLRIEADDDAIFMHGLSDGSTVREVKEYYHLKLLADAGFLEESGRYGGDFRMTNSGHDFLAAVRSDTAWSKVKSVAGDISGAGLGVVKEIALGLVRQEVVKLGFPIG